jgi:hypothetical protein
LRVLRHGLAVIEMAVSPMPEKPLNVLTLKEKHGSNEFDKYLVVSY